MSAFRDGYKNFVGHAGGNYAALAGGSYVDEVEKAIEEMARDINALGLNKNGETTKRLLDDLKGRVAEYWHKGTFNVDAAIKGNADRVIKVPEVSGRDGLGAPDLKTTSGDEFGLKYYKSAQEGAKQQAKSLKERYHEYIIDCKNNSREPDSYEEYVKNLKNTDKNAPLYEGQFRLIPSDQLEDAKAWLARKISEEAAKRPEQAERYKEALDMLTDRISSADGSNSKPLTEAEAKELAKLLKEGGFDPAEFGLTTDELIHWDHIMDQAFNAGLTAAVISVVLEVAPHIASIINKLIREGEVNADDFKCLGLAALKGSSLGYVRGTVASALTIACNAGKLGPVLKGTSPVLIGSIVALTMNTMQNAVLMSFGQISQHDFANRCMQDLTVTSCSLAFGAAVKAGFGAMFQALSPILPVLGFMIGSFVGSVIGAFAYKAAHSCVISYCVESGSTFFGLVKQDYTLPDSVLRKIGIQVFEYEEFVPKQIVIRRFEPKQFKPKRFEPKKFGITVLRRGVIGVNTVGYI